MNEEERLRVLQLMQAQAKAKSGPSGADAMRARGLTSENTDFANQQALANMRSPMQKAADAGGQFSQGAFQGLTGLLGMPSDLASAGLSAATGKDINLPLGGDDIRTAMAPNKENVEPRTELERRIRTVGEYVGPGMAVGGIGGLGGLATAAAGDTAAGLAAGEVRERGGGAGTEAIVSLLAGAVPLGIASKVSKAGQTKRAIDAVPDIDTLKGRAGDLYEAGEKTGKTASRSYTSQLDSTLNGIAQKEGLVSPTGRMSTSYPKLSDALAMVKDYAGQKMAPEQMRQVRRSLQNAAQSADGAEARIGSMMLKQFDEFVKPLVPEFKEADGLYSRAMRGSEVDQAIQTAKTRRSGMETSLSNEFQNLQRKEIRGDLTYPKELVDAVERAAEGGTARSIARGVGKAAPTGAVMIAE